jgi:hypothetical protein
MWGITLFALLLPGAAQAPAPPPPRPGDAMVRLLLGQARRACPALPAVAGVGEVPRVRLVDYARELAGLPPPTGRTCPRTPLLAVRIARAVAPLGGWESVAAQSLLADLYEAGIGVRADPARALEHRRLYWLLSPNGNPPSPFASTAERDLYLARPETIALLRPYAAQQSQVQQLARLRLAEALYAQSPTNRAEALALLSAPVHGGGTLLRARIQFDGEDANARTIAVRTLSWLALYRDEEARDLLSMHARRQLAANPTPAQREEAIRMLAGAAGRLDWAQVQELMAAVREANGGRPPATVSDETARTLRRWLAPPMSENDYPAYAMRSDEEGVVRLRALIGPSGRILFTEPIIAGPQQPWILVVEVRRMYLTRMTQPIDLGPDRPTPYMWVALPHIRFRMEDEE